MNATSHLDAPATQVSDKLEDGIRASFTGGRSRSVFNLGLDISALRPRQRFVVRALLRNLSGKPISTQPAPQS